jgi:hypothetical protein
LPGRNPENAQVTINMMGVMGDRAAIGQYVDAALRQWQRRSGGR